MTQISNINKRICEKRRCKDYYSLEFHQFEIESFISFQEFSVKINGPISSLYENGSWVLLVQINDQYPYEPPSITFQNKIFHPNIDENSGEICLDIIDYNWSPIYDLVNIFNTFLPQLLLDPNPSDPLNHDAANLMINNYSGYQQTVKQYIDNYGIKASLEQQNENFNSKQISLQDEINFRKNTMATNESDNDQLDDNSLFEDISVLSDYSFLSETSNIQLLDDL